MLRGPACRMRFEASTGEPRKQNGAERRARGFKRSGAQDRKGNRDRRRTDSQERAHLSGPGRSGRRHGRASNTAATELVEGYSGKNKEGTNQRSRRVWAWLKRGEYGSGRRNVQASNIDRSEPEGCWGVPRREQWMAAVGRARSGACEGMQWKSVGVETGRFQRRHKSKRPCRSALLPVDHFHGGPSQPGAFRDTSRTRRQKCCKPIHLMRIEILDTTRSILHRRLQSPFWFRNSCRSTKPCPAYEQRSDNSMTPDSRDITTLLSNWRAGTPPPATNSSRWSIMNSTALQLIT